MYLLDVDTGLLLGNSVRLIVPDDRRAAAGSGAGCVIIGDVAGERPQERAAGRPDRGGREWIGRRRRRRYLGDIDGKYWRFNFTPAGTITVQSRWSTPVSRSTRRRRCSSSARTDVYMFFATGSDLLPAARQAGPARSSCTGLKDNYAGGGATTKFAVDLATVTNFGGLGDGRAAVHLAVGRRRHRVLHDDHSKLRQRRARTSRSNLYALTYAGGAAYDTNNNGKLDNNESPIAKTMAGRATAPFIVDQHLYTATTGAERSTRRGVRRSGRLQQRHRAGRRAHPVVAGNSVMATAIVCENCGAKVGRGATGVRGAARSSRLPDPAREAAESRKLAQDRGGFFGAFVLLVAGLALADGRVRRRPSERCGRTGDGIPADPSSDEARTKPAVLCRSSGAIGHFSMPREGVPPPMKAAITPRRSPSIRPPSRSNPQDADSLSNLGQVLVKMNRPADAIPYLEGQRHCPRISWTYQFNLAGRWGWSAGWTSRFRATALRSDSFPTDYVTTFNLALPLHKKGDEAGPSSSTRRPSISSPMTRRSGRPWESATSVCRSRRRPQRRIRSICGCRPRRLTPIRYVRESPN